MKPIHYSLIFHFGSFDEDTVGYESSTPFVPFSVGDYLDHRMSPKMAPSISLRSDQMFRVEAVKHSLEDFGSHITQYVHVCLQVADRPQ
jgi:hypothetical protein